MNTIVMNILMKIITMTMMVITIRCDCYYPLASPFIIVYSIHWYQDYQDIVVHDEVHHVCDIHDDDYNALQ